MGEIPTAKKQDKAEEIIMPSARWEGRRGSKALSPGGNKVHGDQLPDLFPLDVPGTIARTRNLGLYIMRKNVSTTRESKWLPDSLRI